MEKNNNVTCPKCQHQFSIETALTADIQKYIQEKLKKEFNEKFILEIKKKDDEYLVRDGDTLHMSLEISMIAAALGTTVSIETLDGPAEVHVKPGTQSGAPVVIKGKGMTRLRRGDRGDLVVHIEVQTPTKLSKEEESILRSFAQVRGEKASDAHVKGQDGSVFSKLKGVFNK